jgi:exopolyphosphatase/guanosine-5'-triphosphate,3'-diphosphate pyrophosphatase
MEEMAAIDIGTNSTRLLIAKFVNDRTKPLVTELRTTRLGDGINAANTLKEEAIARTIKALQEYKDLIDDWEVKTVKAVATNAVRSISNQQQFIKRVKDQTGVEIEVISGEKEATLSYLGVVKALPEVLSELNLIIDIGGGSTELITGSRKQINNKFSIDVGAVRMTEESSQIKKREELIHELINPVINKLSNKTYTTLGVGGTITTLAAIDQQLSPYFSEKVHGYSLGISTIKRIFLDLNEKSINEKKKVVGLQASRADIIVAGIQILLEIMGSLEINEIIVSESDILNGIFYKYHK